MDYLSNVPPWHHFKTFPLYSTMRGVRDSSIVNDFSPVGFITAIKLAGIVTNISGLE